MDPKQLSQWRKAERTRLIALRESIDAARRQQWGAAITQRLVRQLCAVRGRTIGFCWPFRGEVDARHAVYQFRKAGATAALPEVLAKGTPMQFRQWWPGAPMRAGVYDIPVPAGTDVLHPDVLIIPMNGFDEAGYRLGYGGGYFDRTLASALPRPLAIGVAYEMLRLPTIHPQPYDIPMDYVLTEAATYRVHAGRLERMEPLAPFIGSRVSEEA